MNLSTPPIDEDTKERILAKVKAIYIPQPPINAYMYEEDVTRVQDVYGKFYWVSTRHLNDESKTMIPICNHRGLRRSYTVAGHDNQNTLHRDNIQKVIKTKKSFWFE